MVAAAVIGTAAVGAIGASEAADAQNNATSAASAASSDQTALAREQWDYQKNTYLPKAMQQADEQLTISKALASQQIKDSDYYRTLSQENADQAKKSWKYQDEFMGLTDDYMSGKVGNDMADRANADVEQAYAGGLNTMMRGAGRYGINPGSGEFASSMSDMATQEAADKAGAQTSARRAVRDKAEQMVAVAAGSGVNGFGTAINAGTLASGSLAGASNTNANSGVPLNNVSSTFANGANSAGYNMGSAAGNFNRTAGIVTNNPMADFAGGLATSAIKTGGFKMPSWNFGAGSSTAASNGDWAPGD